MAEKISVQIALEGGQEVARQLEGIGEAGQKAFADIAKSAEQVGGFKNIKPEEVTEKLKALGVEGPAAFDKIQQAVKTAARFEGLVQGVQSVETALVALGRAAGPIGLAIAAGFVAATKATIAFAEEVNKVSAQAIKIGASIQEFDRLRLGLEKAGISGAAAADGIAHFQKQLGEISTISFTGLGQAGNLIKLIGETSNSAAQQLPKFVEQLRQMPDSAERSRLAIEKLGPKLGPELIQALRTGSVGIDQFKQRWGQLTPEMEAAANRIEQAQNRLSNAFNRLNTLSLAPVIIAGLNAATAAIERLGAALERSPWGTWGAAAQLALNPVSLAIQQFGGLLADLASRITGITWDAISSGATSAFNAVTSAIGSAVTAVGNFVSSLTGITWDTISSGATAAWSAVTTAIDSAVTAVGTFVSSIAGIVWDTVSSAGVAAWEALTGAIQSAINKVLEFIGLKPSAPATGGGAPGKARGGLIGGHGSGTSDSNLAWLSRGEFVIRAAAVRKFGAAFFAALNAGRISGFQGGGLIDFGPPGAGTSQRAPKTVGKQGGLSGMISGWIDKLSAANNSAISATNAHLQELLQVIAGIEADKWKLSDALFGVMTDMTNAANALSQAGLGRGGLISGRGSGTSDSNLARLSRGEFVIRAAAVRQFGAGFFAALNAGMLPGFALGGLVPRPVFAAGGPVGGMSHVTIHFPGLPPVGGLRASSAVVEELQRSAALAQIRSGGRKPSRYS